MFLRHQKEKLKFRFRKGTPEGTTLLVRVINGSHEIVNATLALGRAETGTFAPAAGGRAQVER